MLFINKLVPRNNNSVPGNNSLVNMNNFTNKSFAEKILNGKLCCW